jgi:hypothetical protein
MPTMDADLHLAQEETTMERVEYLLTVVACSVTGQPAHVICPWRRRGVEEFLQAVNRG